MNQEDIKKQAKKIMDDFAAALEKSKVKEETVFIEREKDRRQAKDEVCDNEFRETMFKNFRNKDISDSDRKSIKDFRHAPSKKDDFIVAEKGEWEE